MRLASPGPSHSVLGHVFDTEYDGMLKSAPIHASAAQWAWEVVSLRAFARERQKGVRRVALKPRGTAGPRRKAPRGRAAGDSHRQSLPFRRPSPSRSTSTRHVKVRLHARSPTLRRRKVARGSATQPLPRHAAPLTALASAAARAQHSPDVPVLLQVPRQLGCRQLCVDTRSRCRVPREIL